MDVIVVGLPGAKTQRTINNVEEALTEFEFDGGFEWVEDVRQMQRMGIVRTPSVLVNNRLKVVGRIPSVFEVTTWIAEELVEELAV